MRTDLITLAMPPKGRVRQLKEPNVILIQLLYKLISAVSIEYVVILDTKFVKAEIV
jgi:hypothetical protein